MGAWPIASTANRQGTQNMERCDVLIVGGGPAGAACAGRLQQAGCDVLVLDRRTFPRDKTCAGWITPQIVDALRLDLADYSAGRVLQPITAFRVGMIGGKPVEIDYQRVVSYGIRRREFDHYLLQRSGAQLRLGTGIDHWERQDRRWLVNGEIEAGLLIGAGGHFCPIARSLGAREHSAAAVVTAQEVEFLADDAVLAQGRAAAHRPELYFCRDLQGYGWCFRKQNYLNIGLGRTDSTALSEHVQQFCDYLREVGTIAGKLPGKFHGHAYQLYEQAPPRLVDEGVLLIGDAAGLAYPQSGEGIRPAVESGLLAAQVAIEAGGNYSRGRLGRYAELIAQRFGRPRGSGAAAPRWLRPCIRRLLVNRTFAQRFVLDEWFLHRRLPALQLS